MQCGLFKTKKRYFKAPALRRPGRHPSPSMDHVYTGGTEFSSQGISISHDGRRVQNILETVQVEDEDDRCYTSMILDQEGLFNAPDSIEFTCEDTSSDRVQVNKPFVVYVRVSLLFCLPHTDL